MAPLPKTVRIASINYEITPWTAEEADDRGRLGECKRNRKPEIRIDAAQEPSIFLDTLVHEINHAIYWLYGLEEGDNEERVCAVMATGWCQVLRDNAELRKWLGSTIETANQRIPS